MRETKGERILSNVIKVIFIVFVILAWVAACGAVRQGTTFKETERAEQSPAPTRYTREPKYTGVVDYIVQGDDTLLGIAYKMCPADADNEDIYRYARDVERLNGRENDILYWKETIKIYTFEEDGR